MNSKRFIVIFGVVFFAAVIVFSWGCGQDQPTAPQSNENLDAVLRQPYVLESCDQWANYCSGNYCVYNNLWGENAGPQCIYATSTTNWYVTSTQTGGGVKTYPNSSREMADENVTIGSLTSCTSTMNVSGPGNGDYCTAWDIWAPEEVMIWMNKYGDVSPWGSYVETVSLGGTTWDVYKNGYPGFVAQNNTSSMTVDIKAILDYCVDKGWLSSSGVIEKIQGGFEITSTDGQERTFTMNSYSVSYSTGGGGGTTSTTTTHAVTTTTTITPNTTTTTASNWWGGGSWWGSTTTTATASTTTTTVLETTTTIWGTTTTPPPTTIPTTTSAGGDGSNRIAVRAQGVDGSEHIYVTVGGEQIADWTLYTTYVNYYASTDNTGDITVCFDNDDGENRDVQIDYIEVNDERRQAEDMSYNTGVWQNGSCGGEYSEWLHCEGCIGFGSVSGGSGATTTAASTTTTSSSSWWGGGSWW